MPHFENVSHVQAFRNEVDMLIHCREVHDDRWCAPCRRMFQNGNNLRQHLDSAIHRPANFPCPMKGCGRSFISTAAPLRIRDVRLWHDSRDGRPSRQEVRQARCYHRPLAPHSGARFLVAASYANVGNRPRMERAGLRVLLVSQDVQVSHRAQRSPRKRRTWRQAVPLPERIWRVCDGVPHLERFLPARRARTMWSAPFRWSASQRYRRCCQGREIINRGLGLAERKSSHSQSSCSPTDSASGQTNFRSGRNPRSFQRPSLATIPILHPLPCPPIPASQARPATLPYQLTVVRPSIMPNVTHPRPALLESFHYFYSQLSWFVLQVLKAIAFGTSHHPSNVLPMSSRA